MVKKKTNDSIKIEGRPTNVTNLSKKSTNVNLWGPLVTQFRDPKTARKRPLTKITKYEDGRPAETIFTRGSPKRKIKTPAEMAEEEKRVKEALKNKKRVIHVRKNMDVLGFKK